MGVRTNCEFCAGSPIPGICFPADFDDREPCRDGKLFVDCHDECGVYADAVDDAMALSQATGWPMCKSLDSEDEVDLKQRAEKSGTSYYRPYFNVTLAEAEAWEETVRNRRK